MGKEKRDIEWGGYVNISIIPSQIEKRSTTKIILSFSFWWQTSHKTRFCVLGKDKR